MRLLRTERFVRAYRALPSDLRERVNKALRLLAADPGHPSLRLKKMHGKPAVWEARVDRQHRMTFEIEGDRYVLRSVGKHDETLSRP